MTTKQSVLMHRRDTASLYTKWFTETLDESGHPRNIMISSTDWADMGPEIITVTIEPGDLLNDEPS